MTTAARATGRDVARHRPAGHRASAGFSLIEILVAVLIISVGVLGVAGLQLVSLQNNTSAMYRTQAFQAAYEIIDRARANPDENYSVVLADAIPALPENCVDAECTPAELRLFDIVTWLCDIEYDAARCSEFSEPIQGADYPLLLDDGGLPSGDGGVVVDVGAGVMSVTVQWQDERNPAAIPFSVTVSASL